MFYRISQPGVNENTGQIVHGSYPRLTDYDI